MTNSSRQTLKLTFCQKAQPTNLFVTLVIYMILKQVFSKAAESNYKSLLR